MTTTQERPMTPTRCTYCGTDSTAPIPDDDRDVPDVETLACDNCGEVGTLIERHDVILAPINMVALDGAQS